MWSLGAACESDHSVDVKLAEIGMSSPPTTCHGVDSPSLSVWLWGISAPHQESVWSFSNDSVFKNGDNGPQL